MRVRESISKYGANDVGGLHAQIPSAVPPMIVVGGMNSVFLSPMLYENG